MTSFGKLFSAGLGFLFAVMWLTISNWQAFIGSFFVDQKNLRTTEGVVKTSSTYTSVWKGKTYHHYQIEYLYTVNGRQFQSANVSLDSNSSLNPQFAHDYVSKYPSGRKVKVYYDRTDPYYAVLELRQGTHIAAITMLLILVAGYFLSIGIYYVLKRPSFYRSI